MLGVSSSSISIKKHQPFKRETKLRTLFQKTLQAEQYFHPINQKYWKLQLRQCLDKRTLPLQAFRRVLPDADQIVSPEAKVPLVFDLIRYIAQDPIREICGRALWAEYRGDFSNCDNTAHLVEPTHCFRTAQALLAAFFGPELASRIRARAHSNSSVNLKEIASLIHENGQKLKEQFHPYFFALLKKQPVLAPSHVFIVIQYVGAERKLCYRIMQSCLDKYDLQTNFDKKSNFLSQQEFNRFLKQYAKFFSSKNWTKELEAFFEKFFHTESLITIGEINPYFESVPVVCGRPCTFEDVLKNDQRFTALQQTPEFKRLIKNVMI